MVELLADAVPRPGPPVSPGRPRRAVSAEVEFHFYDAAGMRSPRGGSEQRRSSIAARSRLLRGLQRRSI